MAKTYSLDEKYRTWKELGQYLDKIPEGANLIGGVKPPEAPWRFAPEQGRGFTKWYEYKGVYIRGAPQGAEMEGRAHSGLIEVFRPNSVGALDMDKVRAGKGGTYKDRWVPADKVIDRTPTPSPPIPEHVRTKLNRDGSPTSPTLWRKPAPKPAPKPAAKPVAPAAKPQLADLAAAAKPAAKPVAAKPVPKPAPKPVPKPAPKPAAKPVPKPAAKPVPKPADKPQLAGLAEAAKPIAKPAPKPAPRPIPKPAAKPVPVQPEKPKPTDTKPTQSLTDLAGAQAPAAKPDAPKAPAGAKNLMNLGQESPNMARELINPLPPGVGPIHIGEPVTPRQADSAVGVGSQYNQQLALGNLIRALELRRGEKIFGQIPGQKGSTQGEALGRPSPQELMLQMMGGAGRIKEPGVLAHLLAQADQAAKERQAASVEQLRLARLPLQDLRKYVDEAVPGQIEKLMAAYGESKGEMKQLLEDNLQKLSKEGGRIGNVARAAVKGDIASLSKELNVPKADIQRGVSQATQTFREAITEAGGMAEEAGGRTVADISQAAQQAAEGVLPGVEQRAKALGEGYKAASVQEILAQSDSKEEATDIMRDQYGGRKQDIIRDFDEQITQLESQGL